MLEEYADLLEQGRHFISALTQFELILTTLIDEKTHTLEHGNIEQWLSTEGNELLRRCLQGHFYLRTEKEIVHDSVEGSDGLVRTHRRQRVRRQLTTQFGEIEHHRVSYSHPCAVTLSPMDMSLNLGNRKYSDGLCRRVAEEASKASFDECVKAIDSTTGGHVPKRQCEQLVADIAQDFEKYYASTEIDERGKTDLLVISTDSKGIVMRPEDLRAATRKAAQAQAQKPSKARLGPGEKRNRKRMATTAAVYSVAASTRSAEQIMGNSEAERVKRPKIENKRVWASVERGEETVIKEAINEALSRDPQQQRDWVVVVDGEINQLDYIHKTLTATHASATVIVDFIHVLEYLWKAAYSFNAVGSEEAEQWVKERALKILQGRGTEVAAGMRRSATRQNFSQETRRAVDKCADYLHNNRPYLDYDKYLAAGYPIASGVIEGACRHLINDRLGITGSRWRLKTAEAILKLRSLRSSGDFDNYWEFHKKQEKERNHAANYKTPELLLAA